MKIYTKKGDSGETSLFGGTRVKKSDIRIEAFGDIDELNSYIGLLASMPEYTSCQNVLEKIQNNLFITGSMLAAESESAKTKIPVLKPNETEILENEIDRMTNSLPPLQGFILPGGNEAISFCHIARCICRRAERHIVTLSQHHPVEGIVIIYLNRLSDYLFVLARQTAYGMDVKERLWVKV